MSGSHMSGASRSSLGIPPAHHHGHLTVNYCYQDDHVSPTAFKFLGPGTAIREHQTEDESDLRDQEECMAIASPKLPPGAESRGGSAGAGAGNMNDVCFGCDGGCSDATCGSSKRSSQISADVESSCDSPARSPMRAGAHSDYLPSLSTLIDDPTAISPTSCSGVTCTGLPTSNTDCKPVREKDSNENLNCPSEAYQSGSTSETLAVTTDSQGQGSRGQSPGPELASHMSVKRRSGDADAPQLHAPPLHRMDSADSEPQVSQHRRTPGVKFRHIKVKFIVSLFLSYTYFD